MLLLKFNSYILIVGQLLPTLWEIELWRFTAMILPVIGIMVFPKKDMQLNCGKSRTTKSKLGAKLEDE
jgi:hypothetical protein